MKSYNLVNTMSTFNHAKPWVQWLIVNNMKFVLYIIVLLAVPLYFIKGLPEYLFSVKEEFDDTLDFINYAEKPKNV